MLNKPDFIIGGERRSGTTTLYKMISQHPQINMYPISDMDYFIENELFTSRTWLIAKDSDDAWNESHTEEEYCAKFEGLFEDNKIVGQKDADLLFWKPAHARLKKMLPDTKFIFVLREPIARADSQYWNEFVKGRESLTFAEALEQEKQRIKSSDYGKLHLNYKARGKYIESIRHFEKYFGSKQVHFVILEKLIKNPSDELSSIAQFLGVSGDGFNDVHDTHSNQQRVYQIKHEYCGVVFKRLITYYDRIVEAIIVRVLPKDKEVRNKARNFFKRVGKESIRDNKKMTEAIRDELEDYYRESISDLENYLGYSLDEWKIKS